MINYLIDSQAREDLANIAQEIGEEVLETTAQTLKGAINEVKSSGADLSDLSSITTVAAVDDTFTLDLQNKLILNFSISLDDAVTKALVVSNVSEQSGVVVSLSLRVVCNVECAITYPETVIWQNGIAPALIEDRQYLIYLESYDNGTTWIGSWLGEWLLEPVTITYLINDTFNRADSATSLGIADSGQAWVVQSGTWGISGNKAYKPGNGAGSDLAIIDTGESDVILETDIVWVSSSAVGFAARNLDNNNYIQIAIEDTGLIVKKHVDGSQTEIDSYLFTPTNGGAYRLKATLDGSSIIVELDGVQRINATDSYNSTQTKHGMRNNNNLGATFDNITAIAA
jgi:hypothetical protein